MVKDRKISIVIIVLTYNQLEKTVRCLHSLLNIQHDLHKILVFDNGSADGTKEKLNNNFPGIEYHYNSENLGVAGGRNKAAVIAMKKFAPQYLLFIDNDTKVDRGFLSGLEKRMKSDNAIAVTTPKIKIIQQPGKIYGAGGCNVQFWNGNTMHLGYNEIDHGQYDIEKECIASGGCMLVTTDIFKKTGGFDTIFNPYGPEDLDFVFRVKKAGFKSVYVPDAVIYHDERPGRSSDKGKYSPEYAANRVRHWIIFMDRHAKNWEKIIFLFIISPILAIKIILREIFKGNFKASFAFIKQGIKQIGKNEL